MPFSQRIKCGVERTEAENQGNFIPIENNVEHFCPSSTQFSLFNLNHYSMLISMEFSCSDLP